MKRAALFFACLFVAPAAAHPRRPHIPQNPDDDLPHMRARVAPAFAGKRDCIPTAEVSVSISLDSYDGQLVACAQVPTRRGASARFDLVSYACWNVDASTAKLARRGDLGRGYFGCQDGSCKPGELDRAVSYDGRSRIVVDADKHTITIASRNGKATRTFAMPAELANAELLDSELLLVGTTWLARAGDGTYAFDDRGKLLAKLPLTSQLRVLDATHVLMSAMDNPTVGTIYDVATHASRNVTLDAAFMTNAVVHRGALYAMDEHRLVSLDPETFAERSRVPLKLCP